MKKKYLNWTQSHRKSIFTTFCSHIDSSTPIEIPCILSIYFAHYLLTMNASIQYISVFIMFYNDRALVYIVHVIVPWWQEKLPKAHTKTLHHALAFRTWRSALLDKIHLYFIVGLTMIETTIMLLITRRQF